MASKSSNLPGNIDPGLRAALEAMKEALEQGEGHRGDPLQRNLKVQDLLDLGLAQLLGNRAQRIVSGGNLQPKTPPANLAVPPKPVGFQVDGGVFHILLEWTSPDSLYTNHAYTEVWRNTVDNRATAVMIAQEIGQIIPDLNVSYGNTYYYWIRFVSQADVTGPWNAANGTPGSVSQNPQELLDRLTGEITETQLYQDLNDRINLIDGPPTLAGSVAQRVADEADARAQDISQAYSDLELYADEQSTAAITITQLVTEFGGNTANALDFTVSEVDSQLAVTTQFNNLSSRVTDAENDITTKANITYVDQAISDEESARASQFSQLSASVQNETEFSPLHLWNFDSSDEGWSANNAVLSHQTGKLIITGTANADPQFLEYLPTSEYFAGELYDKVRARIRRTAGTGAWEGHVFYATQSHGYDGNYRKSIPDPGFGSGEWVIAEWDMASLTLGGTDWVSSQIQAIRFDFCNDPNTTVEVDWIAVGYRGPGVDQGKLDAATSAAVTQVNDAVANASGSSASSLSQLSTQHGDNTSTIQVQQNSIDGLETSYTVKADVNGYVAGYGFAVTGNAYDDQVHSEMIFSVDRFSIASPGSNELSFIVDSGDVVIDAAYVVNLVVTDADIVSVSVGKISGLTSSFVLSTIGTGNITNAYIGNVIQSDNFVSGSSGWRLLKSGSFEQNASGSGWSSRQTGERLEYRENGQLRIRLGHW